MLTRLRNLGFVLFYDLNLSNLLGYKFRILEVRPETNENKCEHFSKYHKHR
jgi:hypothetical protein